MTSHLKTSYPQVSPLRTCLLYDYQLQLTYYHPLNIPCPAHKKDKNMGGVEWKRLMSKLCIS